MRFWLEVGGCFASETDGEAIVAIMSALIDPFRKTERRSCVLFAASRIILARNCNPDCRGSFRALAIVSVNALHDLRMKAVLMIKIKGRTKHILFMGTIVQTWNINYGFWVSLYFL